MKLMRAILAVFTIGIACFSYAMCQDSETVTDLNSLNTSIAPILRASTWTVEEHSPTSKFDGTWTRRPGTNTFDASWNGGSIKDVIEIVSVEGNNVVLHRQDHNGNYTGTISPDGNSISGTASWYKPGSGWSASIQSSSQAPILRASTWTVEEHSPSTQFWGAWTRRPDKRFAASWNGGRITGVIEIVSVDGNNIVLHRKDHNLKYKGKYTGTISPDGKSISGTASWYKPGGSWKASIPSGNNPLLANAQLIFVGFIGYLRVAPNDKPYSDYCYQGSAWGAGISGSASAGVLYTSYDTWDEFFQNIRGYHIQGGSYGLGGLNVNFFDQYNGLCGTFVGGQVGMGGLEGGGKARWDKC